MKYCIGCNKQISKNAKKCKSCVLKGNKRNKIMIGEDNPKWKGDKVGYVSLHQWIYYNFGKANRCENCKTKTAKRYEWANVSGLYKRDINDWIQLCTSCHHLKDGKNNNFKSNYINNG